MTCYYILDVVKSHHVSVFAVHEFTVSVLYGFLLDFFFYPAVFFFPCVYKCVYRFSPKCQFGSSIWKATLSSVHLLEVLQ